MTDQSLATANNPLGRQVDYPTTYAPEVLHGIPRADARLGLSQQESNKGVDIWNAWELSWLNLNGQPRVACAEIRVPSSSACLIESKSMKLYLGSFNTLRCSDEVLLANMQRDLSATAGAPVQVSMVDRDQAWARRRWPGQCLDDLDVPCEIYHIDKSLLHCSPSKDDSVCSVWTDAFRSVCPVTGQPDWASVLLRYSGVVIDLPDLLRYLVSYRQHAGFHEQCVEQIFDDVMRQCDPGQLTVYARFSRRGGIDINPFRSNFEDAPSNTVQWRQ